MWTMTRYTKVSIAVVTAEKGEKKITMSQVKGYIFHFTG